MKIIRAHKIKEHYNVAIVVSRFNVAITERLYDGAVERLKELDFANEHITTVWVPGAIEIPLAAQRLARSNNYEAIICLGTVIRGETSHYTAVCQQVSFGCQKVGLENDIPVVFGILTTENEKQAQERAGGKHGHKGREAVDAALEMVSVLRQIG